MLTKLQINKDQRQWYVDGQVETGLNDMVFRQVSVECSSQSYSEVDMRINLGLSREIANALRSKWEI